VLESRAAILQKRARIERANVTERRALQCATR